MIIEADVRGHGESQLYNVTKATWTFDRIVQDLIEILQYHDVTNAIWIGFSMGGMLTIHASIYYPSYVHSAVLISAGPYLSQLSKEDLYYTLNSLACVDHNFVFGSQTAETFIELGLTPTQAFKIETDTYKVGTTAGKDIGYQFLSANYSTSKIYKNVLIMSSYVDYIFTPAIITELKSMIVGNITSYNNFSYGHAFIYYYTNTVVSDIWRWLNLK